MQSAAMLRSGALSAPATMQSAAMLRSGALSAPATMQSAAMLRSGALSAHRERAAAFEPRLAALSEPQPHVVPNSAADQPRSRDHVQAVQQRESAQKPFGENGIGLSRTEELVEQVPHRAVPPRRRPGRMVEFV